jgi:7-cyano-7-deazaguanine synthase
MNALLLSGGMDSIALAYSLRPNLAITVNYGQRSAVGEIRAATAVCRALSIEHAVLPADCSAVGTGPLSNNPQTAVAPVPEWWPFRNQLLVTLAAAYCVQRGITEILVGSVKPDGLHADGRAEFYELLSRVTEYQEGNITVSAPAIALTTVQLISEAQVPLEILALAHSCHVGDFACGTCGGCAKYLAVHRELNAAR